MFFARAVWKDPASAEVNLFDPGLLWMIAVEMPVGVGLPLVAFMWT